MKPDHQIRDFYVMALVVVGSIVGAGVLVVAACGAVAIGIGAIARGFR